MPNISNVNFGQAGERDAVSFLEAKGYEVLENNYRNRIGEIDIIAKHQDTLCFIEVKTRQSSDYGSPFEAVTRTKQRQIIRLAMWYLKENKLVDPKMRFDVVAVDRTLEPQNQVQLIMNAFDATFS